MKKMMASLVLGAFAQCAFAGQVEIKVTNNIRGTLDDSVVGYQYSQPVICVKTAGGKILPIMGGESVTLKAEEKSYYDSDLRLNGCDEKFDPYLGYMGIGHSEITFSPPKAGGHNRMRVEHLQKENNSSIIGKLSFLPIPVNLDPSHQLTPVIRDRKLNYVGINLSGAEFGKTISPNSIPDLSSADQNPSGEPGSDLLSMNDGKGGGYIPAGVNTVRIPIHWGYLELLKQPSTIDNPIWIWNNLYWDYFIAPVLATLTNAGVHTILDLHSYLHYSTYGTNVAGCFKNVKDCPDGKLDLNKEHYIKVWSDILEKVRANSAIKEQYLMFDLANEPVANKQGNPNEIVTPQQAFDVQAPVAVALQGNNFKGKILLEGANWTGLHSWESTIDGQSNSVVFTKENLVKAGVRFNENSNNVLINVHQYFDADFSGTRDVCLPSLKSTGDGEKGFNTVAFSNWLKHQKLKAIVTEFGASIKDQGGHCRSVLKEFTQYLVENAVKEDDERGGFVGATLWATGHDWGDYNLLFSPTTYQFTTMKEELIGP